MQQYVLETLQKCPLFKGMEPLDIEMVMSRVNYKLVVYEKKDVFTLAGMPCLHADFVIRGILICRMSSLSGKQVEVSRLKPGNLVAPAFIFAKNKEMPVSVETDTKVEILRLSPQALKSIIDTDEKIRMNFIEVLSNIDVFLTTKMRVLSLFTIKEKVAYLLLEQSGEQGSNKIHLLRSRQEIADSFGIQKFSLLRVLSDFEKVGAIKIDGKNITILNRSKLK